MAEHIRKLTTIHGKTPEKLTTSGELADIVGKTVAAIAVASVDGNYGDEPCTVLLFTDGSFHGFIHPRADE